MFKKAKWIYMVKDNKDQSVYFRKQFSVSEDVKKAELKICALGLGKYTINGEEISDEYLSTPFTRYDKRVIYKKYDVSCFINKGNNVIGVHAGNGFYYNNSLTWDNKYAAWNDECPKLIAELTITLASGEEITVCTDKSWKVKCGDRVYNHMRQGEFCDSRLSEKGFDMEGYNDIEWDFAKVAREPGGILTETEMPPIRVTERISPVSIENDIYNFDTSISGWVKIIATGNAGQKISIKYIERFDEDGSINESNNQFNEADNLMLKHTDIFVCDGSERQEFYPLFCYHGFRYVKIENAPEDIEVYAENAHTDLEKIGSFECNDEMLNSIHSATVRSVLTNYYGMPTDCPHREQNGWTGDAQLSSEVALMNFDMVSAYEKWMNDFKDMQRPNGQLPGVIPSADWGYNFGSGPAWDSALFIIPWNVYKFTGDISLIKSMWQNMLTYMDYMSRQADDYICDYGLADWCSPIDRPQHPAVVTDTAYYYHNAVLMSKMAELMGEPSDKWIELSGKVRKAWREKFLNNEELTSFQTFYACAIYQGLLDEEEIPVYAKKLAQLIEDNGNHIDCGILGTKYIFSALSENGYMDLIYKMITNPTWPSYAYWINKGYKTLCESWDIHDSCNHHMFGEVDNWFYKYLGGISFDGGKLTIKPYKLSGIDKVEVTHRDIKIKIESATMAVTVGREAKVIWNGKEYKISAGNYVFE